MIIKKKNASLAITALIELNEENIIELDFNKMIDAIESVCWTGRIEQVKENLLLLLTEHIIMKVLKH